MTKAEYLALSKINFSEWTFQQCREADALIKQETLKKVEQQLPHLIREPQVRQFTYDMIRCHFGSVEVDQLLMHLKSYPEWMHGAETKQ